MCLHKLPTAARDGLLRPEELVGQLAIREATAEVVSRGCPPLAMAALRYSRPKPILTAS